ncbi:schlafen family member 1-like [Chionomys nivalis]|uniref:schlafen family member 1-like n=1 Tax=Chionomys nivalis TaxID=269649 RepID=UPI002599FAD4|nr:schlafen family member 1-like [Chionomys nivalis]
MAAVEQNITIDPESTLPELVLNVEVTLGMKSGEEMQKDKEETQDGLGKQNTNILPAVCALLNSQGGKVRVHIANQDYNYNKHRTGKDLETSFKAIMPLAQNHLDFKQEGRCFVISVKSRSLDNSGLKPATIATNLYVRNGASCHPMDLHTALQFFEDLENPGLRSPIKTMWSDKRPGEDVREELCIPGQEELPVQEELDVQELAAAFFNQTELTEEKFSFSESKNVEYKSFKTKKLVQRVKDILPKTLSAFANTDGGYLFIGLDEKEKQIVGFEAEKSDLVHLETEIEKCIQKLPVIHFCEEKQEKIKYTCKFIPVLRQGAVCSYVCALRVERFCCAVFAEEPESWHVEDSCVKRFTIKEWVKILMSSRPESGRGINN